MRKLIETTFVTLDGVIQDTTPSTTPQAEPSVWGAPFWDDDHADYAESLLFQSDALLLGRVTYQTLSKTWPSRTGKFADRINAMPKYVASKTLDNPLKWNAKVIDGDLAEEVARLKEQPGQSILKYGTGEIDRVLLANGLIDEFHFWLFPVSVGSGLHLFDGYDAHLRLTGARTLSSGIIVLTYEPDRERSTEGAKAAEMFKKVYAPR
jgi:dihydrofolate reductase